MDDLVAWGTRCTDQDLGALRSERARRLAAAVIAHPAFDIVEVRSLEHRTLGRCDIVAAICTNHEVPNRNAVGIRVRETLGFTIPIDDKYAPEVRALRVDFPVVPHLNFVFEDEPKSLCILIEAWSDARRTWTPQRFLALTLWWLKETAYERLHRPDQPVERVYLNGVGELVLPAGYSGHEPRNMRLALHAVERGPRLTFVGVQAADVDLTRLQHVPVYLRAERGHGRIDPPPFTLGGLIDQWEGHGVQLADRLIERLASLAGGGLAEVPGQAVVLIIDVGITREPGGAVERRDATAFIISQNVVSLAYAMGAVFRQRGLYYAPSEASPTAATDNAEHWRPIKMLPVDVKAGLTRSGARAQAGIDAIGADAKRVLVGAGALGSALADIWAREGWGCWTFVDPDHVQPHNLVRHRAVYADLGEFKVNVVKKLVDSAYSPGHVESAAIPVSATDVTHDALVAALDAADLLVDASTALDVPRQLSAREGARRMASAFITPSGEASIVLLEDAERSAPLHCIEPQYYRQILRREWGAAHLKGHLGRIAVGAGCRDVSTVMSPEIVELHAAILSRQIRILSGRPEAALRVWIASPDGGVRLYSEPVRSPHALRCGDWRVVLDDEVVERLRALRFERTPKETGGIIVGYSDHVSRIVYIVDVLPAPSDSIEEAAGFVRGTDGLHAGWKEIQERTAFIVNYIGEWHSHPPGHGASPSRDDMTLVAYLGEILARDGEPALMIVVAEEDLSISIYESDGSTARISAAAIWR
jgi:hypothetical protein